VQKLTPPMVAPKAAPADEASFAHCQPVVVLNTPITRCRLIARAKDRSVAGVRL
jgi:hypothetical protein